MNAFIERNSAYFALLAVLIGGATVNPHLQTFLEAVWMVVCAGVGVVLTLVLGV